MKEVLTCLVFYPKVSPRRADLAPSLYQKRPKNNLTTIFESAQNVANEISTLQTQPDAIPNESIQPFIQDSDISIVDNLKSDILTCTINLQKTAFQNENIQENDVLVERADDNVQEPNDSVGCQSENVSIKEADIPPNGSALFDDSNSNDISDNLPKRIVKVLVDDLEFDALRRLGFQIVN